MAITKESLKRNVGNPLSIIYDKLEKNGKITFKDIQDEYVHMHNYIDSIEDGEDKPIRVSIDGVEYAPKTEEV
jgi:hypothetical protein